MSPQNSSHEEPDARNLEFLEEEELADTLPDPTPVSDMRTSKKHPDLKVVTTWEEQSPIKLEPFGDKELAPPEKKAAKSKKPKKQKDEMQKVNLFGAQNHRQSIGARMDMDDEAHNIMLCHQRTRSADLLQQSPDRVHRDDSDESIEDFEMYVKFKEQPNTKYRSPTKFRCNSADSPSPQNCYDEGEGKSPLKSPWRRQGRLVEPNSPEKKWWDYNKPITQAKKSLRKRKPIIIKKKHEIINKKKNLFVQERMKKEAEEQKRIERIKLAKDMTNHAGLTHGNKMAIKRVQEKID